MDTSFSFGVRSEKSVFDGQDEIDRAVSGFINSWDATDHDAYRNSTTNQALNVGIEKKVSN